MKKNLTNADQLLETIENTSEKKLINIDYSKDSYQCPSIIYQILLNTEMDCKSASVDWERRTEIEGNLN